MNRMLKPLLASAVVATAFGGLSTQAIAQAAAPATPVTVTITGNDSPLGEVKSSRAICKENVTVKLFRQIGTRGGGDDIRQGSPDTTSLQGSAWVYSFGNPGLEDGWKIYAKVKAHDGCRVAFSPTITVDKD